MLGRISDHFKYPAGYRILKLSRYRISGWFLKPDIRLIFKAGYPVFSRISNVWHISSRNQISSLKISRISRIRYPAKKVSDTTPLLVWLYEHRQLWGVCTPNPYMQTTIRKSANNNYLQYCKNFKVMHSQLISTYFLEVAKLFYDLHCLNVCLVSKLRS